MSDDEVRDGVALKHLDGELFDGAGATKRDLVDHVDRFAPWLLAELTGRPLTVTRVRPGQRPFVQKNLPASAPDWIPVREVWSEASQRTVRYPLVEDRRTLLWLAGQRAVELHPTMLDGSGAVDRLVLDLDPPADAPFAAVVAAARVVRQVLEDVGVGSAVKTSGSKGVHVVVPVRPLPVEDAAGATRALAVRVEQLAPDVATTAYLVEDRGGRVYLDPTRAGNATLACCWSPRARPGVPVSFPVGWDRLGENVPGDFTLATVGAAVGPDDPWRAMLPAPQEVPGVLVDEGRGIPAPRVAAMHEGRRRARARRQGS
ncbi:ATP-dependent DNA ligase [Kineococcus gynurae]|uniref:ATP-dependent DNA ligase n=1 Tax=Kineococcus gynurae TaxID=452979 RepID=A0ABV5LS31_9ACTN